MAVWESPLIAVALMNDNKHHKITICIHRVPLHLQQFACFKCGWDLKSLGLRIQETCQTLILLAVIRTSDQERIVPHLAYLVRAPLAGDIARLLLRSVW